VAEQDDRSRDDLTEETSPYRLEEFRRKGMVAQSREIPALLVICGVSVAAYAMAPKMGAQMGEFMREVFRTDWSSRLDLGSGHVLANTMMKALKIAIVVGLPVCIVGFILAIVGSMAQIGTIFSTEPLTPDLNKINPINGAKRFFTLKHLFESIRILFKFSVVSVVAYFIAKAEILESPHHIAGETGSLLLAFAHGAKLMFFALFGVLGLFAAVDFGIQRWEYTQKLRLTKQEAKQEFKEREGDPIIKARIRSIQREMARRRMMAAVKKADVIVTNPTHIAIALLYQKDKMEAPKVIAKGADFLAQRIKKIAADAGVPMIENVPLARTLYKTVKVGQYVPRALYQAVAEVLAFVYRLKNRKF